MSNCPTIRWADKGMVINAKEFTFEHTFEAVELFEKFLDKKYINYHICKTLVTHINEKEQRYQLNALISYDCPFEL